MAVNLQIKEEIEEYCTLVVNLICPGSNLDIRKCNLFSGSRSDSTQSVWT